MIYRVLIVFYSISDERINDSRDDQLPEKIRHLGYLLLSRQGK
jgi:hypothetical protein